MYEYIITIDYEVELFWKRRFTGSSALFFLNRYLRLWFYIAQLVFWASLSTPVSTYINLRPVYRADTCSDWLQRCAVTCEFKPEANLNRH